MNFRELLITAKRGLKTAVTALYDLYRPMIIHISKMCGRFCEDLFQELSIYFLELITRFVIRI